MEHSHSLQTARCWREIGGCIVSHVYFEREREAFQHPFNGVQGGSPLLPLTFYSFFHLLIVKKWQNARNSLRAQVSGEFDPHTRNRNAISMTTENNLFSSVDLETRSPIVPTQHTHLLWMHIILWLFRCLWSPRHVQLHGVRRMRHSRQPQIARKWKRQSKNSLTHLYLSFRYSKFFYCVDNNNHNAAFVHFIYFASNKVPANLRQRIPWKWLLIVFPFSFFFFFFCFILCGWERAFHF